MADEEQGQKTRNSGSAIPGNSGTVPAEKDLNPPREGREGAQDSQPVEGEDVLNRHPESHMSQKPFPQG